LIERSTGGGLFAHPAFFSSLCEGEEEGEMKRSTGRPFGEEGAGRERNQGDRTLAWTVRPRVAASLSPRPLAVLRAWVQTCTWNKRKLNFKI